ncbi:DUF4215 domain-containing protein [Nannocystis sp. RBIL2]|uniref:DUF4215 domain-containing protein n=1 Tax=Nannocystis sp. RBIL2 TaxID=2996788 RepID=UPI0022720F69|nr:DUF4215 domain-containing protein [Nannocystis sp. RBIL2]MCY1063196.1 DUF4215 domain-containing protein [Nannocystis sp. RBIL2]
MSASASPTYLSHRTLLHLGPHILALTLATCASEPAHSPWQCNKNFVCDPDENQVSCPDDCVWSEATAEGPRADVCDAQENWTFVSACRETCGNGQKDDGETLDTCPRDFPGPGCGDGICAPAEDPTRCPVDCHPGTCGDSVCDLHENPAVCSQDCSDTCGDSVCQAGEELACVRDCPPCDDDSCVCGDMVCGQGESMTTCPQDCTQPTCGNGVQEQGEPCDDGNDVNGDACTNACKLPTCGDGIVWTGKEDCDDGENNGPQNTCNADCELSQCGDGQVGPGETCDDANDDDTDDCAACQIASCGDGHVWAGEELCDDGNDVDTDDCTNACQPATCGDSIVHQDDEECDDGNQVDTDACNNDCLKPRRVIFVTSTKFTGALGLMDDIDEKCQMAAAMNKDLADPSTFKAWVSTGDFWPAMRMDTSYLGMYILVDGTPVAENGWPDLTDGTLSHAIDQTESGSPIDGPPWSNTNANGTSAGGVNCVGWSSESQMNQGLYGSTLAKDAAWTDSMSPIICSVLLPLYCIEDP